MLASILPVQAHCKHRAFSTRVLVQGPLWEQVLRPPAKLGCPLFAPAVLTPASPLPIIYVTVPSYGGLRLQFMKGKKKKNWTPHLCFKEIYGFKKNLP